MPATAAFPDSDITALHSRVAAFFPPHATAAERVAAVEAALSSPAGHAFLRSVTVRKPK